MSLEPAASAGTISLDGAGGELPGPNDTVYRAYNEMVQWGI